MKGLLLVLASALTCAALITAASLLPTPPAVLPIIVLVCVVCPITAASEFPGALATLRAVGGQRRRDRDVSRLTSDLDRLPEVEHPLGY